MDRDIWSLRHPCTAQMSQAILCLKNGVSFPSRFDPLHISEREKWESFLWQAYFTHLSYILINLGHFKADILLFAFEQENLKSSMMGTEQKNVNYHTSRKYTLYKYVFIKDETWYINEGSLRFIKTVIFTQYSSLLPKILKLLVSGTLNYLNISSSLPFMWDFI